MRLKTFIQLLITVVLLSQLTVFKATAHIIPPENFHPVAESYRRMSFMLKLNPIDWEKIRMDMTSIADHLDETAPLKAKVYRHAMNLFIDQAVSEEEPIDSQQSQEIAQESFE